LEKHQDIRTLKKALTKYCRQTGVISASPMVTRMSLLEWSMDSTPLPFTVDSLFDDSDDEDDVSESLMETMTVDESMAHHMSGGPDGDTNSEEGSKEAGSKDGPSKDGSSKDESSEDKTTLSRVLCKEAQKREEAIRSTRSEGMEVRARLSKVDKIWNSLGLGQALHTGLNGYFEKAGIHEDDINMIFNEIEATRGSGTQVSVDDFIEGCIWIHGEVHPLDVVNLMKGLQSMFERSTLLVSYLRATNHALSDTCQQIRPILNKFYSYAEDGMRRDRDQEGAPGRVSLDEGDAQKDNGRHRELLRQARQQELALQRALVENEAKRWRNFDIFFSALIIANAVVLGFEVRLPPDMVRNVNDANFGGDSVAWFIIENVFHSFFAAEMVLRVIFTHQMEDLKDFRTTFVILPRLMLMLDLTSVCKIIKLWPKLIMRDTFYALDVLLVIISGVDNIILRNIEGGGEYARILRVLGLARIARLGRLLWLVKELNMIVRGILLNLRLILWSLIMLGMLIYATSIFMVSVVGRADAAESDELIQSDWGSVGGAAVTLAEMVTYNSWATRTTLISKYHGWIYPFVLGFLVVASLGIMNLITGVMVQAAFQFVQEDARKAQESLLTKTRDIITEALEKTFDLAEEFVVQGKMALSDEIRHHREDIAARNEVFAQAMTPTRPSSTRSSRVSLRHGSKELQEPSPTTSSRASLIHGSKELQDGMETKQRMSVGPKSWTSFDEYKATVVRAPHWGFLCEAYDGTPQAGQAVYNTCNSCVVTHVTWIGMREIAVAYVILEDGTPGPEKEPMRSYLSWDGGRKGPDMVLPYPGPLCPHGVIEQDLLVPPIGSGDGGEASIGQRGLLIFSQVMHGQVLTLRFGGNYPKISFIGDDPSKSAHTPTVRVVEDEESQPKSKLADLYTVDRSVLSLREVGILLHDNDFNRKLAAVDLRPDEVLMVFQNLNVTGSGRIKVEIFVEGLLRMKRPLNGIDVADAKSLMRRLIMEITELAGIANKCNRCFVDVVEKFRHIQMHDSSEKLGKGNKMSELDHDVVTAEQIVLEQENKKLRRRIMLLKKQVTKRQSLLRADGDPVFEARFRRDQAAADIGPAVDDDVASLCSVGAGNWD